MPNKPSAEDLKLERQYLQRHLEKLDREVSETKERMGAVAAILKHIE